MTGYSTLQQDQLKKIGANLQEAREAQSKSIDDIAVQTYIRPQLLKAIEGGDIDDLPQPIFVQGFIRRYAEALGLDGKTLSKQFPVHSIPNTPRPQPRPAARPFGADAMANPVIAPLPKNRPTSVPAPRPTPSTPQPLTAQATPSTPQPPTPTSSSVPAATSTPISPATRLTAGESPIGDPPMADTDLERQTYGENGIVPPTQYPMAQSAGRPSSDLNQDSGSGTAMPYVLAGVLAVAVVSAIALLFSMGGNEPQQAQVDPAPEPSAPAEPAPAPEPEPEPEPTSPSAGSDAPVAVGVNLTGDSWMSIRVDGASVFEGLMSSGTTELYEGQERVYISVGNAGAVELSYNGSDPEVAGPSGAVREFTYTP
ncbi:MAG: RodZ domain-containing protein [Cyanobacteria bacterium J06632_22]